MKWLTLLPKITVKIVALNSSNVDYMVKTIDLNHLYR